MLNEYLSYLQEGKIPTKWRPRVEVFIMKNGLVAAGKHPEIGYQLPGGGVEPGQNLKSAAKAECLEEAGMKIKNVKIAIKENYYEDWYALVEKGEKITKKDKIRMKTYRGIKHNFLRADFDGYDKSLYGSEDDALKRMVFMKPATLIREFEKQGKTFDPPLYAMRIKVLRKLR